MNAHSDLVAKVRQAIEGASAVLGGVFSSAHHGGSRGGIVIVLGVVLLVLGLLLPVPPVVTTIGVILLVLGAVLWVLGSAGHPVGGRRYWY